MRVGPESAGAPPGAPFTWAAVPARNARRTTVIVLLLVVALGVARWVFQAASAFLFLMLLAWLLSGTCAEDLRTGHRRSA